MIGIIECERLHLRPIASSDSGNVLALDSDPEVRRFVEDGCPVTPDETLRMIQATWPVRILGDEHGDVEYGVTRTEWQHRLDDHG